MTHKKAFPIKTPDRISSYFLKEWFPLLLVTVTGIIYNIGLTASPWFEGQLAQMLCDIIRGSKTLKDIAELSFFYVLVILFVQGMRCTKRFYVRRFANNVSRHMKHVLYRSLTHKSKTELENQEIGSLMTKAISDVDTCVEGMRKFTTEIFDTGIVMAAYLVMLLSYDWHLTLLSCIFPPFACLIAEKLKKYVSKCTAEFKESAGRLNGGTLERIQGTLTCRILGGEPASDAAYEQRLNDYEKKAVKAGILENTMQPLYQVISMIGVLFILWFGAKNVQGTGHALWNIASFTTFLSCFSRLALKSSKTAKLFNAVQKAEVSWKRIRPLMHSVPEDTAIPPAAPSPLRVENLSFSYHRDEPILKNVCFQARPGQIIGITGPVASGKSTLGKIFLCERPYNGSIRFGNQELSDLSHEKLGSILAYMGHEPELIDDTIAANILLGDEGDVFFYLKEVCMDTEVAQMPDNILTPVGSGGIRLSGGQQARIALARTLCHKRPLLILDDPFSALDRTTEKSVMENLRHEAGEGIILLISHRLYLFPEMDRILWLKDGTVTESTHEELIQTNAEYRELYQAQTGGI